MDEFGDCDEGDPRTQSVQNSDPFEEFVTEESARQPLGVQQIDVHDAVVRLVECEGFLAVSRQRLEQSTSRARDRRARLTMRMELRPRGVPRLLLPLLARYMHRQQTRNLTAIKAVLEG